MKDKLISLDALRKEVERNLDMQDMYLPVHILDVAEDAEEGIVRCEDCKRHYNELKCPCGGYRRGDWFCADGERR